MRSPNRNQVASLLSNKAWAWFLDSLKERAAEYRRQFEAVSPEDSLEFARLQARIRELDELVESPLKGIEDG